MPKIAKPLLVLMCLVALALALVRAAAAQERPAVDIRTGTGAAPAGSKLAFSTTAPEFCTSLLIQGSVQNLTTTQPVRITAYDLLAGDSAAEAITARISARSCDDSAAGSALQLDDFKPGDVRQVWLAVEPSSVATYTGPLLIQAGTAPPTIYTVEVARRPREVAIEQPAAGSLTVDTKAQTFTRTLAVRLPDTAGAVGPLQYSYTLERSDGAEAAPATLVLLHDGQDANKQPVELPPGVRVALTLVGELPQAGSYTGQLLLLYGDGQTKSVPLTLQHTAYAQAEGLAFPTPEPSRWTAEPWEGAKTKTTFQLENTSDLPIALQSVKLVALNQVKDGQVIASWLDHAQTALTGTATSGSTLDRHTVNDLVLAVIGLPAGEYEARISALTPDGRKVESATKFFVRHQLMPFLVVIFILALAWAVQDRATVGRKSAMADLRLSQLGTQIRRHLHEAAALPAWIQRHDDPQRAWIALEQRLDRLAANARMQRNAQESEDVANDIEKRVSSLDEALGLAKNVDGLFEINKIVEGDPERSAVVGEVLQQLQKLYRLLEGPKEKLDDIAAGAPGVIAALKKVIHRVRRMRFDALLGQIRKGLTELNDDTALTDPVKILGSELDAIAAMLDAEDFDAGSVQGRLTKAENTYYDLLWQHLAPAAQVDQVERQLVRLEGKIDQAANDAAKKQLAAVKQAMPAAGNPSRDKVKQWQDVEPQLWLAQVLIWQAELATAPGDVGDDAWRDFPGRGRLNSSLADAATALRSGAPDQRSAYEQARAAQIQLQRDLVYFRLDHMVVPPLAAGSTYQAAWEALQVQAVELRSKISARGPEQVTAASVLDDRLKALLLLVQGLEIADKALDGEAFSNAVQLDGWVAQRSEIAKKVAAARSAVNDAVEAQTAQGSQLEDKAASAETSYVAAAAAYNALVKQWKSLKEQEGLPSAAHSAFELYTGPEAAGSGAEPSALSMPIEWLTNLSDQAVALFAGPRPARIHSTTPLQADYADYLELDAEQRKIQDEYRISQYEKQTDSIKRQIRLRNLLVYLVAFLITVLFAVVDKVFSNPTFGDWPDYVTLILFTFGATGISNATMGSVMNTLGLTSQQQG